MLGWRRTECALNNALIEGGADAQIRRFSSALEPAVGGTPSGGKAECHGRTFVDADSELHRTNIRRYGALARGSARHDPGLNDAAQPALYEYKSAA
jgi:hypothetical protein